MTVAIARDPIYRRRRFSSEVIELCVRWYLTYKLSYRDQVEMMAERGIAISHSTILRWVQRYVPEFERRWARYARRVNSSWRMDETVTLAGVELVHRIRKRQFSFCRGTPSRRCSLKHLWARALACHDAAISTPKVTRVKLNRHCTRTQVLAC